MRYLIILFFILGLISFCYADRVCLEKNTGELIEYQSGGSIQEDLDIMVQNAINAGYKEEDIEAKFVTEEEWQIIKKQWLDDPIKEEIKQKELKRKEKEQAIKLKLNLSDKDFADLKEALD